MVYKWIYKTPTSFDDSKQKEECIKKELPIFEETSKWLDIYFRGKNPEFTPKYKINNLTLFREEVIAILNTIDYGSTITYKDIASKISFQRKIKKMSSQAVGGAVGSNPICIIIPCHRVVGSNGRLIGYGGGIKNKEALLHHEQKIENKCFKSKEFLL